MNVIVAEVLKNPLIIGYTIGAVMNGLHDFLVSLDKTDFAKKYGGQLHVLTGVLTFLSSAAALAANGQLSNLDLTQIQTLINTFLPMVIGAKAAGSTLKK